MVAMKRFDAIVIGTGAACLAGSHEIETFSGGKNYLRRGFLIIFDFLARTFSTVIAPLRTSRLLGRINFRFARHSGGISATRRL